MVRGNRAANRIAPILNGMKPSRKSGLFLSEKQHIFSVNN
jgi:hypothetical protein